MGEKEGNKREVFIYLFMHLSIFIISFPISTVSSQGKVRHMPQQLSKKEEGRFCDIEAEEEEENLGKVIAMTEVW